jgi:hypothetical protein
MNRKPKEKIKPQWMRWYEESFQSDVRVRYMKPMQRHLYRALIIQSFYCDTRPYLRDDDEMLWMLADADSKEHWMQHAETVRGMFTPVVVDGEPMLSHGKILREWKSTEVMYSGKAAEREAVKQDTYGQPKSARRRTKVGDKRTEEQTRTDQNRPETRGADNTLPDVSGAERSEGDPKLTNQQTSRQHNQNAEAEQAGLASASGSQSASQSVSRKENGSGAGQSSGRDGKAPSLSPEAGRAIGSGKPVTGKVQSFEEEKDGVYQGTTAHDLIRRFWDIAKKKPDGGKWMGVDARDAQDDIQWMQAFVKMQGVEKIKLCLDHIARSDYWGCSEGARLKRRQLSS